MGELLVFLTKFRASNTNSPLKGFAQKIACEAFALSPVIGAVNELESSVIPLLASPQGGVAASSIKFRAATKADAAGVVFLARPLLLAVMQGGESPYSNF